MAVCYVWYFQPKSLQPSASRWAYLLTYTCGIYNALGCFKVYFRCCFVSYFCLVIIKYCYARFGKATDFILKYSQLLIRQMRTEFVIVKSWLVCPYSTLLGVGRTCRVAKLSHQVTHQVRLHLALICNMFIQFIILIQNRAAFRTCRLYVFKEVHLTVSSFL